MKTSWISFLPLASEGCGRKYFQSVHTHGGGGVISSSSHNTSIGPMSFSGRGGVTNLYSIVLLLVPSPCQQGTPVPGRGHPVLGYTPGQDRIGYPLPVRTGWDIPLPSRTGLYCFKCMFKDVATKIARLLKSFHPPSVQFCQHQVSRWHYPWFHCSLPGWFH